MLGKHVRINLTPPLFFFFFFFIEFLWKLLKNIYREIGLKAPPFPGFPGKIFPRQTAKNYPLSRETVNTHAVPLYIRVGGGGACKAIFAKKNGT